MTNNLFHLQLIQIKESKTSHFSSLSTSKSNPAQFSSSARISIGIEQLQPLSLSQETFPIATENYLSAFLFKISHKLFFFTRNAVTNCRNLLFEKSNCKLFESPDNGKFDSLRKFKKKFQFESLKWEKCFHLFCFPGKARRDQKNCSLKMKKFRKFHWPENGGGSEREWERNSERLLNFSQPYNHKFSC